MTELEITGPLDPRDATEEDIAALNVFNNILQAERLPDEPRIPLQQTRLDVRNIPEFVEVQAWIVWDADRSRIVATANVAVLLMEENRHLAEANIGVLPEARGRGLGTRLLAKAAEAAAAKGRRMLIGQTYASVPAGEAFLRRIGATPGMVTTTNQLLLAEVDHDMLRAWQERAGERASDFELGLWRGPYPEEELERAAAMMESANLVPREQLDLEDFHFTPEQLRDRDLSMVQRGFDRWTLYAEHRESGQIAGFTEVLWNPSKPDLLEQGGTCVFEEYQNRGLGRWLKAAMIDIVERECPQARRIQTGNANSNAPMLSINREMGFKPYIEVIFWQAEIDRIREYLGAPAATAG